MVKISRGIVKKEINLINDLQIDLVKVEKLWPKVAQGFRSVLLYNSCTLALRRSLVVVIKNNHNDIMHRFLRKNRAGCTENSISLSSHKIAALIFIRGNSVVFR